MAKAIGRAPAPSRTKKPRHTAAQKKGAAKARAHGARSHRGQGPRAQVAERPARSERPARPERPVRPAREDRPGSAERPASPRNERLRPAQARVRAEDRVQVAEDNLFQDLGLDPRLVATLAAAGGGPGRARPWPSGCPSSTASPVPGEPGPTSRGRSS